MLKRGDLIKKLPVAPSAFIDQRGRIFDIGADCPGLVVRVDPGIDPHGACYYILIWDGIICFDRLSVMQWWTVVSKFEEADNER